MLAMAKSLPQISPRNTRAWAVHLLTVRANPLRSWSCFRPFSKLEGHVTQFDDIAIGERCRRGDTLAPDERAVGAVEIGEHRRLGRPLDMDARVSSRYTVVIEPHVAAWIAADDVVAHR